MFARHIRVDNTSRSYTDRGLVADRVHVVITSYGYADRVLSAHRTRAAGATRSHAVRVLQGAVCARAVQVAGHRSSADGAPVVRWWYEPQIRRPRVAAAPNARAIKAADTPTACCCRAKHGRPVQAAGIESQLRRCECAVDRLAASRSGRYKVQKKNAQGPKTPRSDQNFRPIPIVSGKMGVWSAGGGL